MWKNCNSCTLTVEMENGTTSTEKFGGSSKVKQNDHVITHLCS